MPQIQDCPTRSEPPNAKGVSRSRWVGPGICIFETPFPLPGPPRPRPSPSQARLGSAPSLGDHSSPANPRSGDEIFITYILAPPAAFRESK